MTNNKEYLDRLYYEYFKAENILNSVKQHMKNPSDRELQTELAREREANDNFIIIGNLLTNFLELNNFKSF